MKCVWHDSNMIDSSVEYDYEINSPLVPPVQITL